MLTLEDIMEFIAENPNASTLTLSPATFEMLKKEASPADYDEATGTFRGLKLRVLEGLPDNRIFLS